MNPIFDTTMLKHYRKNYGTRIETEGARRPMNGGRRLAFIMVAILAMGLVARIDA